jgi:hypothetical protein
VDLGFAFQWPREAPTAHVGWWAVERME